VSKRSWKSLKNTNHNTDAMLDPKKFREHSEAVISWIDSYLKQISTYPVKSTVSPGEIYGRIPVTAPEEAEPLERILKDLDEIIIPGITHWQHPGFHAYFPANSSVESVLAEFITAAIGAQCMIWDTSPAAAELEQRMMEWLRDALGIPREFEGVIQDTASSATLAALLTAREVKTDFRSNEEGVPGSLRIYCSVETHSSVEKAAGICGIGKSNLVKVGVDDQMRMLPDELENLIRRDLGNGYVPCAVVATIGTTGTVAVDPLKEIAEISRKYNIWLHVDAAYAGSALLLPEYRWMIEGIERADSFVFNPHKWMFTNFDCSVYLVRDTDLLIRTFEILPEYLKTRSRGTVNDYRDWGIALGRRFRALKLWFVIRSFGLSGLRQRLRSHIRLNEYFCGQLVKIPGIDLMAEPFLNFSCFRLIPQGEKNPEKVDRLNERLLNEINDGGRIFLTHTRIRGRFAIRMVIGQTYVDQEHVELALSEIKEKAYGVQ
jgi:aromatic-L-amino-acid decarboxylase